MKTHGPRLAIALTALLMPSPGWTQHEAQHQPAGIQATSTELTQCVRVQPVIQNIVVAATARAEAARLSNSPSELRAALDHLEAALRDIRAQSEPCAAAAAATNPHAGHAVPTTTPSPATAAPTPVAPAGAADPHAGHTMPSASPASKGGTKPKPAPGKPSQPTADPHAGHTTARPAPTTKPAPAAAKPEGTKSDPHAGHSQTQPADKQMDPVNGLMVDPATAPKTTYQGQTYYFSSEQSKKEFLENPAKFAKKPKG